MADCFAGIGGMRLGFEQVEGVEIETVFANDSDAKCGITYMHNFGKPFTCDKFEDLMIGSVPKMDILTAGFPCQPFSCAGLMKGTDDARGNLVFRLVELIRGRRPKAFLLENVSTFATCARDSTFRRVGEQLAADLPGSTGYDVHSMVLNAKDFGVPQNRPRLFMVGFSARTPFMFPSPGKETRFLRDIVDDNAPSYTHLSQGYVYGMKDHRQRNRMEGNGFGYDVRTLAQVANCLTYGGTGRMRNWIYDHRVKSNEDQFRELSVREHARIQGFPEEFEFPVSRTQAYKQIGNSVAVPLIRQIADRIVEALLRPEEMAKRLLI